MRIDNTTRWSTSDLRYMIGQALHAHGLKSSAIEVTIRPGRGLPRGIAGPGRREPLFERVTGAQLRRAGVRVVQGKTIWITLRNPGASFDPKSEAHLDFVVSLARLLDALAIEMNAGKPSVSWREKPIRWLSDWYEVRTSEKGRTAGSVASPLLPTPAPTPEAVGARRAVEIEHAQKMLKRALTREKRAATITKKWRRKLAALESRAVQ